MVMKIDGIKIDFAHVDVGLIGQHVKSSNLSGVSCGM
jgi:hypothetical protein